MHGQSNGVYGGSSSDGGSSSEAVSLHFTKRGFPSP